MKTVPHSTADTIVTATSEPAPAPAGAQTAVPCGCKPCEMRTRMADGEVAGRGVQGGGGHEFLPWRIGAVT
ncbi:hypothetical protein [uncultured Roseibium sp.]|uniref:hypothetical protein n=1 Tax=uncultured Roseibium sp. TaxID=1936171 RepID=UPI00321793E8